jgi:uncharacterized membrane protein
MVRKSDPRSCPECGSPDLAIEQIPESKSILAGSFVILNGLRVWWKSKKNRSEMRYLATGIIVFLIGVAFILFGITLAPASSLDIAVFYIIIALFTLLTYLPFFLYIKTRPNK